MSARETQLQIVIDAQDRTRGAMERVTSGLQKHEEALQGIAVASGAALAALGAVAFTSINAYAEAERSARQLEYAIMKVSGGTRDQVNAIREVTAALEKKAGVDADSINMGAAQLATFGLQADSVVKLTKTMADLTVNQNGAGAAAENYVESANMIARALRGQVGMLERVGIRFTEAQENAIKYGTEAEKVAAIQEGFAQNLRETTDTISGVDRSMAQLRTTMGNIQEGIGAALAPALNQLLAAVQPVIEAIAAWVEQNPTLAAAILAITGLVAGLTFAISTLALATLAFTAVAWPVVGVVALVGAAIVGLGATIYSAIKIVQLLRESWREVWAGISLFTADATNAVIGMVEMMVNAVVEKINGIIRAINRVISLAQKVPGIGDKFKSIPTIDAVSFDRITEAEVMGSFTRLPAPTTTIQISGNMLLDDNAAETIGDKIMKLLGRSAPLPG